MNKKKEHRFFTMLRSASQDTLKSIERNNLMSFASVASIVAALLILGIFIIITINVNSITNNVKNSLELKVFMKSSYTQEDLDKVQNALTNEQYVTGITYESSDEALAKYSASLGDYSGLLSGFTSSNNPLNASFIVQVDDPSHLEQVKTAAEKLKAEGVDYVKYGEQYVDALVSFSNFMNWACAIILIILSIISIIIIYNTIKLTCYSRRKEIGIMKFIGATDWYIRLPFFFEGSLLGIIGAVFATLILRMGYIYMVGMTQNATYLPMQSQLIAPGSVMGSVLGFCLVYGILMGVCGSLFSIRKFLDK
ncbi:MAG: permease-like cell division protein FtsX [Eubacteriaceae bacterium]